MKKLLSVLLLVVMCLTSLSACGKTETSSTADTGTSSEQSDMTSTDEPSSSVNDNSQNTSSDASSEESSASSEIEVDNSLRGTTVTFASWEDFNGTERGKVIQNFTKATGIKVNVVPVTQNDYVVKLASRQAG